MHQCVLADENVLRVFTWEGYVTQADLEAVNARLAQAGNPVRAQVIKPYAEGPEQMFNILRQGRADVAFLTLNYLKMQNGKTAALLQPINVQSKRLSNYTHVLPSLKEVAMGMDKRRPLYVPFGGGAYGLWANMHKLRADELPDELDDLLAPRWKGHLSLTTGQVQPNVALAMMASGLSPFALDQLIAENRRHDATLLASANSAPQLFLNRLYGQVGAFWRSKPAFLDQFLIVASYGPEIAELNANDGKWKLIQFKEGNTVWLDTMNISRSVSGLKLEAAEIFINYFLGKEVQQRVVAGLSMVAVTTQVGNPLIEQNPDFFEAKRFWRPYHPLADNLMRRMSDAALAATAKNR